MIKKGQIKYEAEEHLGQKFLKIFPNTAKVIYVWGRKALVLKKIQKFVNSKGVGPVRADFGLKFQVHLTKVFGHFLNT